jgi:4-hydroxy-tetrahydrodipicolinate reductase
MSVSSRREIAAATHRIIQWGTGNTGAHTLRFLLEDPAFDVVGVWVQRERNIGRTAGELAGLAVDGPSATQDVDDLVAMAADCVVYMAAEPTGSPKEPGTDGWESVDTMCRLLASGKNVVATGISGLTNPRAFGNDVHDRLRQAAESGGTTFFGTGIEPGFMCDALALSLSSISRNVRSIRAQESLSYATYDQPNYHVSQGGIWGAPCDPSYGAAFAEHILAAGMGGPVLLLADALGVALDDLTAVVDLAAADEDFEVPMGPIGKGTVAGYRFELLGIVGGEARIAVEHITRIHADVAPHWPSVGSGGFRVIVDGTPSFTAEVIFDEDDPTTAGCVATAARVVNSIPIVCAAPPGVCSFLDLPMISAAGSFTHTVDP